VLCCQARTEEAADVLYLFYLCLCVVGLGVWCVVGWCVPFSRTARLDGWLAVVESCVLSTCVSFKTNLFMTSESRATRPCSCS
jgi:hypothetical protein